MSVLALDDINAGYGETEILHGISMKIDPGEVVVIIGPNGAGKSTAMKAIFGMLNITAGRIVLEDQEITSMPPDQVVRQGICYVPQVGNVFVTLSVQENLEMGGYLRDDDIRPRMDEIYGMFPDLAEKRRQPAGSLSGGQRHMVAMGRALMLEPKVLMLDEPTAGLSPKYRGEIFETVKRINATGVPILMVSGDDAAVDEVRSLVGDIEPAIVKWNYGFHSARTLTPDAGVEVIREAVSRAMARIDEFEPYSLGDGPITVDVSFKNYLPAENLAYLPVIERIDSHTVRFLANDMIEASKFMSFVTRYRVDEKP